MQAAWVGERSGVARAVPPMDVLGAAACEFEIWFQCVREALRWWRVCTFPTLRGPPLQLLVSAHLQQCLAQKNTTPAPCRRDGAYWVRQHVSVRVKGWGECRLPSP